tara:strand:- start:464 stop:649 length:186 start_codon:yes stop_codon:yes gene_type:complete
MTTAPTRQQIIDKFYEIELLEGGIEAADSKRVCFLAAISLGIDPADVRSVLIESIVKVGAG